MGFCSRCGKELAEGNLFCPACGASVTGAYGQEHGFFEEKELTDKLHRFLRYERLAWKIPAIVMLCYAGFFAMISFLFLIVAIAEEPEMISGFIMLWLAHIPMFASTSIVGFVNIKNIDRCIAALPTDPIPAISRCGSVGMIVVAALFNNIALVFVIINFVFVKSSQQTISRILNRREGVNSNDCSFN